MKLEKYLDKVLLGVLYLIIFGVVGMISLFTMDCDDLVRLYLKFKDKFMNLTWFGLSFSAIYVLVVWAIIRSPLVDIEKPLELNELGDFCAGVFGPLAIFWLILGFFQQKKELEQNREALLMQAVELKKTVEHQGNIAEVTKQQAEFDREVYDNEKEQARLKSLPKISVADFRVTGGSLDGLGAEKERFRYTYQITFRNEGGGAANNIGFTTMPQIRDIEKQKITYLGEGEERIIEWEEITTDLIRKNLRINTFCFSKDLEPVVERITYKHSGAGVYTQSIIHHEG